MDNASQQDLLGSALPEQPQAHESKQVVKASPARNSRAAAGLMNRVDQLDRSRGLIVNAQGEMFDAASDENIGFVPTTLINACLPYDEVFHYDKRQQKIQANYYERVVGEHRLYIQGVPGIGIPYGRYPRLTLILIATLARRQGRPDIFLGDSFKEFALNLGIRSTTGGARGQGTLLKKQVIRTLTSHIHVLRHHRGDGMDSLNIRGMQITNASTLLFTPASSDAEAGNGIPDLKNWNWQGQLQLSPEFYAQCLEHSCPVAFTDLLELSALGIDIYNWITYRNFGNYRAKKDMHISWLQLKEQFGPNYQNDATGMKNFKADFRRQLQKVMGFLPQIVVIENASNLLFKSAPPKIAVKTKTI